MPASTDYDHKYYECFLNRYKTFIAINSCPHIRVEQDLHRQVSIKPVERSMDGVFDYYAKDKKGAIQ